MRRVRDQRAPGSISRRCEPCRSAPPATLPQVSNQSLGDYLKASIFTPANLTGAVFVPGTGGSLVENLVNNPGYVSLFTASAGACHCACKGVQRWSGCRISKLGLELPVPLLASLACHTGCSL